MNDISIQIQKIRVYQMPDVSVAEEIQTKYLKTLSIYFNSDLKGPVSLSR